MNAALPVLKALGVCCVEHAFVPDIGVYIEATIPIKPEGHHLMRGQIIAGQGKWDNKWFFQAERKSALHLDNNSYATKAHVSVMTKPCPFWPPLGRSTTPEHIHHSQLRFRRDGHHLSSHSEICLDPASFIAGALINGTSALRGQRTISMSKLSGSSTKLP
nr:hypothetical protein [uncultured Shimia sp.]